MPTETRKKKNQSKQTNKQNSIPELTHKNLKEQMGTSCSQKDPLYCQKKKKSQSQVLDVIFKHYVPSVAVVASLFREIFY